MYFSGSPSYLLTQSAQQNPISCFLYSTVRPATMSFPVSGHFLLIGSSTGREISSTEAFLNSLTFLMYFSGSPSNLLTQSAQQNPISCFLYSTVRPATMSFPVSGHFLLIGSSTGREISSTEAFLNSLTFLMYFSGSPSNLLTQSAQQNPISCFLYSTVRPATMSFPVSGHFLLIGSSQRE